MKSVYYIGMDVHKETVSIAVLKDNNTETVYERTVDNDTGKLLSIVHGFTIKGKVTVGYEAGCLGYTLYRRLKEKAIDCRILAPNKVVRSGSDKIKTDKRDAILIARMLKHNEGESIYIPSETDEATRDLMRCREDLKEESKRSKQQLQKFLLRYGFHYDSDRYWTLRHSEWMRSLNFIHQGQKETFEQYFCHIEALESRISRIDEKIVEIANSPEYADRIRPLRCFKGIDYIISLALVCEIGDFRRFKNAGAFMAYLGLVPSEFSSGGKRRQGRITKTGNGHLRKLLVEASWHYRYAGVASKRLEERRKDADEQVISYADKALHRLNKKFVHLTKIGKSRQLAVTATARELCGFVWGAMNHVYD